MAFSTADTILSRVCGVSPSEDIGRLRGELLMCHAYSVCSVLFFFVYMVAVELAAPHGNVAMRKAELTEHEFHREFEVMVGTGLKVRV